MALPYLVRAVKVRMDGGAPPLRPARVVWAGDRIATAIDDFGRNIDVIVPNGLWAIVGARVGLFRYPDGWVIVGIYRGWRPDDRGSLRATR